jgi:hypothetical protein
VVECKTHGVCFTLYPPGHVPYGRVAVAPVGADGHELERERGADDGESTWDVTIFRAARDAACGRAWPRRVNREGEESWRTQGRRIELAATLFAVSADADAERHAVALALDVTTQTLRDAAAATRGPALGRRYAVRGRALMAPLAELGRGGRVLGRVLAAGTLVGQWGCVHRWGPGEGRLRALARGPP